VAVGVGSKLPDLSTGFAPISTASADLNRAIAVGATGFGGVGCDAFNYLLHDVILVQFPYESLSFALETKSKRNQLKELQTNKWLKRQLPKLSKLFQSLCNLLHGGLHGLHALVSHLRHAREPNGAGHHAKHKAKQKVNHASSTVILNVLPS
jgi:hypothetical protein